MLFRRSDCFCAKPVSLERDVVVLAAAEVGVCATRRARGDELVAAATAAEVAALAAPAEELDRVCDHLDRLALRAVLRFPLAPLEAAVDADGPSLREVLRQTVTSK